MADEQDKTPGAIARARARVGGWVTPLWERLPRRPREWLKQQAKLWREEPGDEVRWRWQQIGRFVQAHYVTLIFAFLLGLILFGFDGLGLLGALIQASNKVVTQGGDIDATKLRDLFIAFAAFFGAPFFLIRAWIAERQTKTSEEGQMTDRISKAVEQLGAEKTVKTEDDKERTDPNLEVRLGGIFALERISQDSARDHWQVMEILTAYVRENSRAFRVDVPKPEIADDAKPEERAEQLSAFYGWGGPFREWLTTQPPPRADLQTAITVIGRRQDTRRLAERRRAQRLDLRGSGLVKADLSGLVFSRANLGSALLNGAHLRRANLSWADLIGADLSWANLSWADLIGADLIRANLSGANLSWANLIAADLFGANLMGADLYGANLGHASCLPEVRGLRHTRHIDKAKLPTGWSVSWNEAKNCWDIETPDGSYVDPDQREQDDDED